jgi:septal ring factor EnvC (AmiA/AmiB activator)
MTTQDINTLLDVTIEAKKAELVVLRANLTAAEEAHARSLRTIPAKIEALRAELDKSRKAYDQARQAVQEKEQEITNTWSEVSRMIDDMA